MQMNEAKPVAWTLGKPTPSKKQLIVAIDHGFSFPDMRGLEEPMQLVRGLSQNARVSGLIASPGIYRQAQRQGVDLSGVNRFITVDYVVQEEHGGKTVLTHREIVISPEEAADWSPDCFKMYFNLYADKDELLRNVLDFTRFAAAGNRLGISCLAEVLFFSGHDYTDSPKKQAEALYNGCRMAMEAGADALKIPYHPDISVIGEIVDRLGLPTFILGGAKSDNDAFLASMRSLASAPVCGVMLGRNIWQSTNMSNAIDQVADALCAQSRMIPGIA